MVELVKLETEIGSTFEYEGLHGDFHVLTNKITGAMLMKQEKPDFQPASTARAITYTLEKQGFIVTELKDYAKDIYIVSTIGVYELTRVTKALAEMEDWGFKVRGFKYLNNMGELKLQVTRRMQSEA